MPNNISLLAYTFYSDVELYMYHLKKWKQS